MTEDENCKPPLSPRSSTKKKKKKKKRKKVSAENTEKPLAVSLPPETLLVSLLYPQSPAQPRGQLPRLRATSKDRERLGGKKPPKDSPSLLTETNNNSGGGSPEQGYAAELSTQARESLRWEGVLEDPEAEEKRLELYKVNRRQRYISHREAVVKETQKD